MEERNFEDGHTLGHTLGHSDSEEKKVTNGAKIVSSAVLGLDVRTAIVNGKVYFIQPPTIKKLLGMGYYLSDIQDNNSILEILHTLTSDNAAHALSWGIKGDDSLYEELLSGTFDEIVNGLSEVFSQIRTENFIQLSALTKSIANLIAKPKL